MSENYTPINTNPEVILEQMQERDPEPVEKVEVEAPEQEPDLTKDLSVDTDSGDTDEPVVEDKPKPKPKKKAKAKAKPSRRDKRIEQLWNEKNEEAEKRKALEKELHEMRQLMSETHKASNESQKTTLEATVSTLSARLKDAMENGDAEEAVTIQDKLISAKMELNNVEGQLNSYEEVPAYEEQAPDQVKPSEKALDWVDEHPEFNSDRQFYIMAMAVNEDLVNEGFNPDGHEFYAELDTRLGRRFPEYYDIDSENVVQSSNKNKNSSMSDETENESDDEDTDYPQTVSGASRTPSGSTTSKGRKTKNTVVLSPEDQELCRRWGLTPLQYARRKQAIDGTDKDVGDYTPIKTR